MKTNQVILSFALVLLSTFAFGQAEHTATLVCDIQALRNNEKPSEVCYFAEDPETPPEIFTIDALVGDEIIWDGEESILIKEIIHKGGENIFAENPRGNGQIKARPNKPTNGNPYRYMIQFRIDGEEKVYVIDPLIKTRNQ